MGASKRQWERIREEQEREEILEMADREIAYLEGRRIKQANQSQSDTNPQTNADHSASITRKEGL